MTRLKCFDCSSEFEHLMYMVKPEVWSLRTAHSTHPNGEPGILCLLCLQKRLGRQLTIEDFNDTPINKLIFFGHAMPHAESALRCKRCTLGIDDDQDGDCSICANMMDLQARRVKTGVQQLGVTN